MPDISVNGEAKAREVSALKNTLLKYGAAMIILTLNSFFAARIFTPLVVSVFVLSGMPLAVGGDDYYLAVMLINELSSYVIPAVVLGLLFAKERGEFVPDTSYKRLPGSSLLLFFAGISAGSAGSYLTKLISRLLTSSFGAPQIRPAFSDMKPGNTVQFGIFLFCLCVIAPCAEEYIFRSVLLKPMRRYHDAAAAIMSGALFGLYHGNFDQLAYASLLGFFCSVIAVRANSIAPTIIFHAVNNLIVCVAYYLPDAVPGTEYIAGITRAGVDLLQPVGIIALIILIPLGACRMNRHSETISGRETAKLTLRDPAVLIGLAAMLAVHFFKL